MEVGPRRLSGNALALTKRTLLSRLEHRSTKVILIAAKLLRSTSRVYSAVVREAEARISSGNHRRARGLVLAILDSPVISGKRRVRGVDLLLSTGDSRAAIAHGHTLLATIEQGDPERPQLMAIIGHAYNLSGDSVHATEYLLDAVSSFPDQKALLALIDAAARAHDDKALATALDLAENRKLDSGHATTALLALAETGKWLDFERLASFLDMRLDNIRSLIKVAVSAGQLSVADALAASVRPADRARAYHYLGRTLDRHKKWLAAAEAYESAIMNGQRNPVCHYRLGRSQARAGHDDHALAAYHAAISATPQAKSLGAVAPIESLVHGWVPTGEKAADADIVIKLNGQPIAWTKPVKKMRLPDGSDYLEFRRRINHIRKFVGSGDVLHVEHAGTPLPFIGSGNKSMTYRRGRSRSDELLKRIGQGALFNELGQLQISKSNDKKWQHSVMQLFKELRVELHESFGVQLIPFYGSLLGAVRENNFISYDHDYDAAYISPHSSPMDVRRHFYELCAFLIDKGYDLVVKSSYAQVRKPDTDSSSKVDIFYAWFTEDGRFQVSYGYHGEELGKSEAFFTMRTAQLAEHDVKLPSNAEDILAQLYGATWRTPDPGWTQHRSTRRFPREHHLSDEQINALYWHQFYRDNQIIGASSFARFVAPRLTSPSTVIDLGCGNGRDSVFFASMGHRVWAADRSREAIERAQSARSDLTTQATFEVLDVSSADDLADFLRRSLHSSIGSSEIIIYLRFFLHAISEDVEDVLMKTISDVMNDVEFRLFAEFRTEDDKERAKIHGKHYRRYINEEQLVEKLDTLWGFRVEHLESGTGLAPWREEDPCVARIIARR